MSQEVVSRNELCSICATSDLRILASTIYILVSSPKELQISGLEDVSSVLSLAPRSLTPRVIEMIIRQELFPKVLGTIMSICFEMKLLKTSDCDHNRIQIKLKGYLPFSLQSGAQSLDFSSTEEDSIKGLQHLYTGLTESKLNLQELKQNIELIVKLLQEEEEDDEDSDTGTRAHTCSPLARKIQLLSQDGDDASFVKKEVSKTTESGKLKISRPAKELMKKWFMENINHPYPTIEEKDVMAGKTGLTRKQVQNWFTNTRKRYWDPWQRKEIQTHNQVIIQKHIESISLNQAQTTALPILPLSSLNQPNFFNCGVNQAMILPQNSNVFTLNQKSGAPNVGNTTLPSSFSLWPAQNQLSQIPQVQVALPDLIQQVNLLHSLSKMIEPFVPLCMQLGQPILPPAFAIGNSTMLPKLFGL